jgi:hypothetical protein
MPVSKKYLDDHKATLHTPESWARALAEQVMNAGIAKLGEKSAESVSVDAQFHVSAYEPKGCIRICGVINGIYICYHVNI